MKKAWRVGRKLGRTLYKDDVCVGIVDNAELATVIVRAVNGAPNADPKKVREAIEELDAARDHTWSVAVDRACRLLTEALGESLVDDAGPR